MSHLQQIEQAKQGLLVYLQANRQYIEETVYNVFNVECIQQKTLDTLNIDKMKKTIKDIFDFGDNRVYQYFFSHMESNIKAYIKQEYAHKAAKDYYLLDVDKLTDIVKFCILHGFNFEAAKKQDQEHKKKQQEDKKKQQEKNKKEEPAPVVKPRPPSPQPPSPPPPPKKFYYVEPERPPPPPIIDQPIPVFDNVKPKIANKLDPSLIPEKKEFKLQKYPMPEKHVLPRYLMSKPKAETVPKEQQTLPTVAPIDQSYLLQHRKTIRERLVKLFNFYCFQQSSLGARPTFDHIKGQGELMSIGNFMQFCQYTKVFSCKEMTKDMLMIQFKKTAEGRIQIDFQAFEKLIQQIDEKYLKLLKHDPSNNPIPSYEARLMLNEPAKLGQLKKDRHLIFGTKAKEGRELFDRKPSRSARYETKELTVHSGRFSDELENGLKLKSLEKSSEKPKAKRVKKNNGSINLSDLTKIRLPKLPWIDEEDDTDVKVKFGKKLM